VFSFVQHGLQCLICVTLPKHLICSHMYSFSCEPEHAFSFLPQEGAQIPHFRLQPWVN